MFKFFKEKIKSWVKRSKEKVEEDAEKVDGAVENVEEEKVDKKAKRLKKSREGKKKEKVEKKSKKLKKPVKEEVAETQEDDLEVLKEEAVKQEEEVKEIQEEEDKLKKELEKVAEVKVKPLDIKKKKEVVLEEIDEEVKEEEERLEGIKKELEEAKEFEPVKRSAPTFDEIQRQKPSFFKKLKERFSYKLSSEDFEGIFEDLELMLLDNNVALEAVEAIKKKLSEELVGKEIKKDKLEEEIKGSLKNSIDSILMEPDDLIPLIKSKKPFVIVFFGINGSGKTTTIARVAHLLQKSNLSCVLAAADTFRAASIEQIQYHADNLKLKLIKHDYGADPAAVGFDAIKYAKAHNVDVVLVDTAGRMHTSGNLLSEMEKICRVTDPDLKVFVAESVAGNDAVAQAKNFDESVGIDGVVLTKADVDEKGGTAISISYVTQKPILFLGTGQKMEDLKVFDKEKFIEELGL